MSRLLVTTRAQLRRVSMLYGGWGRPAVCHISSSNLTLLHGSSRSASASANPHSMSYNISRQMHALSVDVDDAEAPKKKMKRVKKDKDVPKRALSAYILFGSATRVQIKEENPAITSAEIMRELGVRWQAMSATDKAPFEAQAVADKLRFKKEMDAYEVKVQVVTGDERGRNKSSSSNSEMPAPRRRPNKVKKDPNAPKRAVTSYLFYSHDWREKTKEDCPDLSPQAVMKELGERWKTLPVEEKAPYLEKAALDKIRYKKEIDAYEAKEDTQA